MTNVILPKIPRGSLEKVYVLSKRAADEFFRESSEIVKKYWPIPETYIIPNLIDAVTVTLKSVPKLWLPSFCGKSPKVKGIGKFGIGISYCSRSSDGRMDSGLGKSILEFLCEAESNLDNETGNYCDTITPNSHIFIYDLKEQEGIQLPEEAFFNSGIDKETEKKLNQQIRPAFKNIGEEIKSAMETRGAVLTRGWLTDRFII